LKIKDEIDYLRDIVCNWKKIIEDNTNIEFNNLCLKKIQEAKDRMQYLKDENPEEFLV